jgi:probable F420-dependent oxidoreductase
MKYFFHYPETSGTDRDMLEAGDLATVAAAAERAGFDGAALTEHPVPSAKWLVTGGHQSLDPFVALGFMAAATEHLRLLTHLVVAPYRNPFLLAKAATTVDKLSGGRFVMGLGAGYQKSEFYALGVDIDERGRLFEEVLEALPLHWSGEPFDYRGTHFDARSVIARPRPVQDPIPIWIGGNSKAARRRVVQYAQGWMPMSGSPELSSTAQTTSIGSVGRLAELVRELKDDFEAAGRKDEPEVLWSYTDPGLADPTADADRHREALAEIEAAGVTSLVVSCFTREEPATLDWLESFGATYCREG